MVLYGIQRLGKNQYTSAGQFREKTMRPQGSPPSLLHKKYLFGYITLSNHILMTPALCPALMSSMDRACHSTTKILSTCTPLLCAVRACFHPLWGVRMLFRKRIKGS